MAQNFIAVDRDQALLMPPSLQEWLPPDHYAWFVLASVEQMDLSAFRGWVSPGWSWSPGARSGFDGRVVDLRVFAWGVFLADDRARVCGGHRVPGDRSQPEA